MNKTDTHIKPSFRASIVYVTLTGLLLLTSIQVSFADDFYWVGGTGKWSDYKNHWAKTSGGLITQGRVPTFKDNVFFDENSFFEDEQSVQIDILIAEVNDISFSEITNTVTLGTITGGRDLTVFGSMELHEKVRSTLTEVIIAAKSKDASINSAGVFLADRVSFINSKDIELNSGNQAFCKEFEMTGTGEVGLKDSLLVSSQIQITNGTFNTNSHFIKTPSFTGSGSTTSILLVNSIINVNQWNMNSIQTFSAGNSSISVNNTYRGYFNGANLTYYDVFLCGKITIGGSNAFHELTFCEGSDIELQVGTTQKTDQLIAEGTPGAPIRIASEVFEETAFIQQNSSVVDGISLILEDVHAKGAAIFNAENSVDLGNVSGWNIIQPIKKTFYWVRGSGSWSDYKNHWATSSGGVQFHEGLPTVYDEVIFDEKSFSTRSEVELDLYHAYSGNMNWSAVDDPVNFYPDPDIGITYDDVLKLHVFGSLYFNKNVTSTIGYVRFKNNQQSVVDSDGARIAANLHFYHMGEYSILAHNQVLSGSVHLWKEEGTTIIEDSVLLDHNLVLHDGSLIIDNSYISAPYIDLLTGEVDITKSEIRTVRWNAQNLSEFKSDSSTIYVEGGVPGYFYGGNLNYFDVILCGQVYVYGENTYHKLELCPGADIYLPANQTQIADSIVVIGDPGFPISISSDSEDQQASIKQNGGAVNGKYLYLKDSKAIGAIFSADETVDLGNVDGWNISSPAADKFYWIGGSGAWGEYGSHWATASGAATFHDRIPGALDDVYFDENSFTLNNSEIVVDQIKIYAKHVDFSMVNKIFKIENNNQVYRYDSQIEFSTVSQNFQVIRGYQMWVFGSFLFNKLGNSNLQLLKFPVDTADFQIVSEGRQIASSILFDHHGIYDLATENEQLASSLYLGAKGKVNLIGDLKLESQFVSSNGEFITNDHRLEIPSFDFSYNYGLQNQGALLDIGNSHITVNSWQVGDQVNFSSDTSEINVLNADGSAFFYGGSKDYSKVNAACIVYFRGDNSYERLTFTYGAKIFIEGEQTVEELLAKGTSGNPIKISGGSFRKSNGKVESQYVVLNNNKANGEADFIAERSIDGGGNDGWQIHPPDVNVDANELDILNGEPLCGQAIETTLSLPPGLLLAFQWFKDGVALDYDSSTIVVRDEGIYYVELTNACGTIAKSNDIDISREAPPEIPKIYKDGIISVCGLQPIDVKMQTDEQPRVHYNWMRNGVIIGEDEPSIIADTVGTYSLRLTKGECVVDSKDSVVVVIKDDIPIIQDLQLIGNDTICVGDSSQFFVPYEAGTTYHWNNGDTIISTQAHFFEAKTQGDYTLMMENGCGNTDANDTYFLMVKEVPEQQQIIIDGPDVFCYYDSVLLVVPLEEEVTYQWFVNDDVAVNNFSTNEAYSDTVGNYYLAMENMCGVTTTEKVEINHIYLPVPRDILIERDTIFCIGDSVIFSIDNYSGETWIWYKNGEQIFENIERISISEAGMYSTDISNVCGTTMATNMPLVEVKEIPPPTSAKDFYERCGPGELTVKVSGGDDGKYVWRDESSRIISGLDLEEIIVPLDISKDYFVTLTNGYCEGPGSLVNMNVLEVPVADAGEDKTVIYGDEIMIGGIHDYPNTYYLWALTTWMNRNTSPTPTIRPEESAVYTVEAIGVNGCSSFDEMSITVSFEVVIPNTFTPNNDGTNDSWTVRNILFHPDAKVEIFNRWGTKLYETVGYQNDWGGTYNGDNLPVDTYFYVIQFSDGTKPKKGSLTILR